MTLDSANPRMRSGVIVAILVPFIFECMPAMADNSAPDTAASSDELAQVIVTAQKRTENLKDVPASISVLSATDLQLSDAVSFEDISREVPGLSFNAGNVGIGVGEGEANIEMRGVSSAAGAATVGVYLDDIPITVDTTYGLGAPQPSFLDLDRVEVLRGPQGTLYGAGSEGGTIRFVMKPADVDAYEGKVSTDLSGTYNGGLNYEGAGVLNVPVVPGVFGLRGDLSYTRTSGWIDNYSLTGNLLHTDVNSVENTSGRLAGTLKLSDNIVLTPQVYYQFVQANDTPVFYLQDESYYLAHPTFVPPPLPTDGLYRQHKEVPEPYSDYVVIPSLTVNADIGFADLTSVSDYYYRNFHRETDGTTYNSFIIGQILDSIYPGKTAQNNTLIGQLASPNFEPALYRTISQEVRLSSRPQSETGLPLKWVVGFFYSDQSVDSSDYTNIPGLSNNFESIYGFGINSPQSPLSEPGIANLYPNDVVYAGTMQSDVRQYAGFGQVDIDFLHRFHGSIGYRYAYGFTSQMATSSGYFSIGLPPISYSGANFSAGTPKVSLTYDLTDLSTMYATVAKGYRFGGELAIPVPSGPGNVCQPDYTSLGITNPSSVFGPDSVWSYEAGTKLLLLDRTLSINASAFFLKWADILQTITLPTCGYQYTLNAGDAESYGGELEIQYKPPFVSHLVLGLSGSVDHAAITSSTDAQAAAPGQKIPFVPEWTLTLSTNYSWQMRGAATGFFHADYDLTGPSDGSYITTSPSYLNPEYGVMNLRSGVNLQSWEIALYAKNALDNHTIIQKPTINSLVEGYTVTPLTVGVTVTKRF